MKFLLSSIVIVLMGGAFLLGRLSSSVDEARAAESIQAEAAPSQSSLNDSTGDDERRELDSLRAANARLEKDLAATQAKLHAAAIAADRYAAVREGLLEQGEVNINLSSRSFFVPDALYNVLNLDAATRQRLEAAFDQTFVEIREWERDSAVVQEHTDERVVYRLPASDLGFSQKLETSLGSILNEEDQELVMTAFNKGYEQLGKPREISLDLLEHDNPEMISFKLKISELIEGSGARHRSSSAGSYMKNSPIKFDRWSHLFGVE